MVTQLKSNGSDEKYVEKNPHLFSFSEVIMIGGGEGGGWGSLSEIFDELKNFSTIHLI